LNNIIIYVAKYTKHAKMSEKRYILTEKNANKKTTTVGPVVKWNDKN